MSIGNPVSGRHMRSSAKTIGREGGGMRTRTPIVLLTALLTAIVAVSGLTIKLVKGERTLLEDAGSIQRREAGNVHAFDGRR